MVEIWSAGLVATSWVKQPASVSSAAGTANAPATGIALLFGCLRNRRVLCLPHPAGASGRGSSGFAGGVP